MLKFLVGVQRGKNQGFHFSWFNPLFCQSTPINPTKVAEQVYLGILQHPTKLQAEMLENFILDEN